ncbi:aspartate-semialdehyde dehydrogenase [Proteiniclasticum sp. C24MP]|uniref:aspartate-semialdehyde dehydrogenase n=1 Tax=Proteiniclasticum sp. C24MP TaxID=3374101 RepID=UPI00375461A3
MDKLNLAIVGATGMVGRTFLTVLEEMELPLGNLVLLASERSAGKKVLFQGKEIEVEELTEGSFDKERFQYALFSAGGSISEIYAPIATQNGITVIDNSSQWRMHEEVPLVVPEINMKAVEDHLLISNPNCSTIQSVLPLKVIHDLYQVERVAYTTYQAVSGSGQKGVEDLLGTRAGKEPSFYPKVISDNCLPQIDVFLEDGYTKEEQKMVDETRKILEDEKMKVTATCVRVPVLNGHSVAMNVTCREKIDYEALRKALASSEGIIYYETDYPTARDATGQDQVLLGRLRKDESLDNSLHLWCVADNIRKGAASNAVEILKRVWEERR